MQLMAPMYRLRRRCRCRGGPRARSTRSCGRHRLARINTRCRPAAGFCVLVHRSTGAGGAARGAQVEGLADVRGFDWKPDAEDGLRDSENPWREQSLTDFDIGGDGRADYILTHRSVNLAIRPLNRLRLESTTDRPAGQVDTLRGPQQTTTIRLFKGRNHLDGIAGWSTPAFSVSSQP